MGCFNYCGFLSNLPIQYNDDIVIMFGISYKNENGFHGIYPTDNVIPTTLPIFGKYDDYGSIDDIIEDDNVKYLESYFGCTIKDVINIIEDRNYITNVTSDVEDKEKFEEHNDILRLIGADDKFICGMMMEHRFVYEKLSSMNNKLIINKPNYLNRMILEDLGFVSYENSKSIMVKNNRYVEVLFEWMKIVNEDEEPKDNEIPFDSINNVSDFVKEWNIITNDNIVISDYLKNVKKYEYIFDKNIERIYTIEKELNELKVKDNKELYIKYMIDNLFDKPKTPNIMVSSFSGSIDKNKFLLCYDDNVILENINGFRKTYSDFLAFQNGMAKHSFVYRMSNTASQSPYFDEKKELYQTYLDFINFKIMHD